MSSDASSSNNGQPSAKNAPSPRIETRWERSLVARTGGKATLLVRVVSPAGDDADTGRAAPLDVAFVLDRSGSMRGGKLDLAREGVDLAVSRLRDADRAALVVYDSTVDTVQPLAPATPRMKASLRLALHGIDPGGSTFLSGGWLAGCQALAEASPQSGETAAATRIRRVILLTDGLANVGILDPGELSRHAGELRRRGIATTTLGVGQDFDEGLLSAMAESGGGNFQYIAAPEGLRAFFASELQELFSVAATGFTVTLTLPPGLRAELISAFPTEKRNGALDVAIGDLPAGDEIDLVFSIAVGPGAIGDALLVGVTACWTDPQADARRETGARPDLLRRAAPEEVAESMPDALVVEQAALQRAAAERRAGLELDRAGRFQESRARMAMAYDHLVAAPQTPAIRFDLAESEDMAVADPFMAYGSHVRKSAQLREAQRRRGRLDRDGASGDNRR